jgi:hypothetical protein
MKRGRNEQSRFEAALPVYICYRDAEQEQAYSDTCDDDTINTGFSRRNLKGSRVRRPTWQVHTRVSTYESRAEKFCATRCLTRHQTILLSLPV